MKTIVVKRREKDNNRLNGLHRVILVEFLRELSKMPSNHWVAKLFASYIELAHDRFHELSWQLTILDGDFVLYHTQRPDIYTQVYSLCDPKNIEMMLTEIKELISHKAEEFIMLVHNARRK